MGVGERERARECVRNSGRAMDGYADEMSFRQIHRNVSDGEMAIVEWSRLDAKMNK